MHVSTPGPQASVHLNEPSPFLVHAASPSGPSRIRGQGLRSLLHALAGRFDADTVAAIFQETNTDVRPTLLSSNIAVSGWYPISWYAEIYRACRIVTGAGPEIARELRAEALRRDAKGLFRFLLRFATPAALVRHSERVCALYLEGPVVKSAMSGPQELQMEFSGLRGYDESCVHDHIGGASAALELSGGVNIALRSLVVAPYYTSFVARLGWQ
jgi:hypothetical protein